MEAKLRAPSTRAGKVWLHVEPAQTMKALRIAVALLAASLASGSSYTVTLPTGATLAGNHRLGPDDLATLFPTSALGSANFSAWTWDVTSQTFQLAAVHSGAPWSVLVPVAEGSGVLLQNVSTTTPTVTIPAAAPATAPALNLSAAPNQLQLTAVNDESGPTGFAALLHDPLAAPSPTANTYVGRWNAMGQTWTWSKATLGVWGITPSVPVGEAALVGEFSGLPAPLIIGARLDCAGGAPEVIVTFDRDVDPITAADPSRYAISPPLVVLTATPRYLRTGTVQQPSTREVALVVSGLVTTIAATHTVSAPTVEGLGGAAVLGSASFHTGLVPVGHVFDCTAVTTSNREPLCLTFDQALDAASASAPAHYALAWTGTASGSATASHAHHAPGSASVCLDFPSLPGGGVYSLTLTYTGLKTECGVASSGTYTFATTCAPVVQGRVFRHDPSLGACGQDTGLDACGTPSEVGLPGRRLALRDASGVVVGWGVTDANGDYSVRAPAGSYTLELDPALWFIAGALVPPSGPCSSLAFTRPVTLPPAGPTPNEDFPAVLPAAAADLGVWGYIRGMTTATPCCGQDAVVVACYYNYGPLPTPPTTLTMTLPGGIATVVAGSEFPGAPALTSPPGSATPSWIIPALAPGAGGYVSARLNLACPIGSLNTLAATAAIVTPACLGPDANPANNTHAFTAPTTCAYDPNTKSVDPEGCGPFGRVPRGTTFTYRVDFQNTGSGPADEVIIRDRLDPGLDLASVRFRGASHLAGLSVDAASRELTFLLPAIKLPAAMHDEPGSHGFVLFEARHLAGVADGTRITNGAAIYFDANPPILTRVVLNPIVDSLPPAGVSASVWPNTGQAGHTFSFQYAGPAEATVHWNFGPDATPAAASGPLPVARFATPGMKTVSLTAAYGECFTNVTLAVNVTQSHCAGGSGAGYTVALAAGFNFVGVQLEAGGNTLAELFPGGGGFAVMDDVIQIYHPARSGYTPCLWDGLGWVDAAWGTDASGLLVPAGTGILVEASAAKTILLSGCPATAAPARDASRFELICSPTVGPGSMADVLRSDPAECTVVFQWNGAGFDAFRYRDGAWTPSEPLLRLGEAVFVGPDTNCLSELGPVILRQPADQFVTEGLDATFSIEAAGAGPRAYQWQKNGTDLPGATRFVLTLTDVRLMDSGSAFRARVSNAYGSLLSEAAWLQVEPDVAPPTLISVEPSCASGQVMVTFSERVSQATATDELNYQITGGVAVQRAVMGANPRTVCLFVSQLIPNLAYQLTVDGVEDLHGNRIAPRSSISFTCAGGEPNPRLDIAAGPGGLTLAWASGWTLQSAATPTGPWAEVPGATSPWLMPNAGSGAFFRLRNP